MQCLKFVSQSLGKNYAKLQSSQDLSIIYLKAVNSHRFNQSDLDTRSWYHGTAASMECLQAPLRTPLSPDRSRLVPIALNYTSTRLARPKPNQESVRRLAISMRPNFLRVTHLSKCDPFCSKFDPVSQV